MKKIIILSLLFLSANFSFGQKPALEKIGGFKMYDSVKSLTELGLTEVIFKKNKDVSKFYYNYNPKLMNLYAEYNYELLKSIDALSIVDEYNVYINPKVRKFVLKRLELIPNLVLNEVELIYYNDSLISFNTSARFNDASIYLKDNSYESIMKLSKLLDEKYDCIVSTSTEKAKTTLGETREITSFEYKTNWPTVKCKYEVEDVKNSLNETIKTYFTLELVDVTKLNEIRSFDYQLKNDKDLKKYDTNKL